MVTFVFMKPNDSFLGDIGILSRPSIIAQQIPGLAYVLNSVYAQLDLKTILKTNPKVFQIPSE